jgi:hypothetical protein
MADAVDAVTAVVDPIGLAKEWIDRLKNYEAENTKAFIETATEQFLSEQQKALEARLSRMGRDTAARLSSVLDDEFVHLQQLYRSEAATEARAERRRMLGHAASGAFGADLSLEAASRVHRALRGLEPEDVLLLEELDALTLSCAEADELLEEQRAVLVDPAAEAHQVAFVIGLLRRMRASKRALRRDALISVGCCRLVNDVYDGPLLEITELGVLVIKAMADYLEIRKAEARYAP